MQTDHLEIEVKLFVANLDDVAARLEAAGAEQIMPRVFEHNVRYEDRGESLTGRGIVLRLRRDERVWLTYKEPTAQTDSDILTRFEAEVEVDDSDTMAVILERLGYHPHVIYEKYRTTYALDGTEVVLDELPYGHFVEIEGDADAIRRVMERLRLQDARRYRTNYLTLFDNVRRHLGLEFNDLTFENFEGIEVPESAFEPL